MSDLENNLKQLETLVRPNIRTLKPYSSARDEFDLDNTNHLSATVFLDANENSLGSPLETDFSRYPDPHQRALKHRLARREGLSADQIFLGNGSDEAIDLLLRAFCQPGQDNVIVLPPTYGMYAVQAGIHGAELRAAPLRPDFSPDPVAVQAATDKFSKIIFLCSPNNPTGNHLPETFIRDTLHGFPGLVVVDEAYGDFSDRPSLTNWLQEHPNLVVLKTFSKAWGLAGLRVGMAFAHPLVIATMNKIKYPYNLGAATLGLTLRAMDRETEVRQKIERLLAERQRLTEGLRGVPFVRHIYPSDANFLLVRVVNADSTYDYLLKNGIVVRNRSREIHCENCLRITVGAPKENDRLLFTLLQL